MCAVLNLSSPSLARAARCLSLLALFAAGSAWAQTTTDPTPACARVSSNFPPMTYDENVRYLANSDCRTSLLAPIQYIPLGQNENNYLSFGFWIRERGEYVSNPNWSDQPSGNAYLMQRYFLHTDLHLGERFRFFGELASSLVNGRNAGPRPGLDEEKMYLHQGFFDLGLWKSGPNSLTLRAGRQEVALGSQLLVSTRDGAARGNDLPAASKAVNEPSEVVFTGGGLRGLSAAGSAPADLNFDREMVCVEDEPAQPALQR